MSRETSYDQIIVNGGGITLAGDLQGSYDHGFNWKRDFFFIHDQRWDRSGERHLQRFTRSSVVSLSVPELPDLLRSELRNLASPLGATTSSS
jgi:hypothetical protein